MEPSIYNNANIREIEFRPIEEPRQFPEFQAALDRIAERLFGYHMSPDNSQHRLWLEWGGRAKRRFHRWWVPKYRRCHYKDLKAYAFAGNPAARSKHERKPFITYELDEHKWPARWQHYKLPTPIHVTAAEPYPLWYVTLWMSPQKAAVDWNDIMYGAPEPRQGLHYPILPIGAPRTESNPFGYRHPDTVDLETTEKIIYEMTHDLQTMGHHIDDPMGDSEINNLNYWIERGLAHEANEESQAFRADIREILEDFKTKSRQKTFSINANPEIINPHGGKATRDVQIYMPGDK